MARNYFIDKTICINMDFYPKLLEITFMNAIYNDLINNSMTQKFNPIPTVPIVLVIR